MTDAPTPPPAAPEPRPGLVGRLQAWIKRRNDETQARWDAVLHIPRVRRTRALAKVVAIHVRYTSGYLMTGFLVSAPIQLGYRHAGGDAIFKSVVLGVAFGLPFVLLIPFTKIDWAKMRLPEFKNLELGLMRWTAIASGAFLMLTLFVELGSSEAEPGIFDKRIAWVNFMLMAFAWVRVQFDYWLFREFYTLHPDDDTLVLFRLPPDLRDPPASAPVPGPGPGPGPGAGPGPGPGAGPGPGPGAGPGPGPGPGPSSTP